MSNKGSEPEKSTLKEYCLNHEDIYHWRNELKALPTPTVRQLFYFLNDEISDRWRDIGVQLKFCNPQLNDIETNMKYKANLNSRCMLELFDRWIEQFVESCNWSTLLVALIKMKERKLAYDILNYMIDFGRIRKDFGFYCKKLVPLKEFCYEETELEKRYFQADKLARVSIGKYQQNSNELQLQLYSLLKDQKDKWFEMGISMSIPKVKLSEMETNKMDPLMAMIQELIQRFSTWKKVIDGLLGIKFENMAEEIEKLALDKCNLKMCVATNIKEYRKADFEACAENIKGKEKENEKKIKKCIKKIREKLGLSDLYVKDDDIVEKLYEIVAVKKPNRSDLKIIIKSVEDISNLTDEHARWLVDHAEKLKQKCEVIKGLKVQLEKDRIRLDRDKRTFEEDSKEISQQINKLLMSAKTDEEKSQLSDLESNNKKVLEKLEDVCKEFNECLWKLEDFNAQYHSIQNQLNECQSKLKACESQLLTCLESLAKLKGSLKIPSTIEKKIEEVQKGFQEARTRIQKTQDDIVDVIEEHPYPYELEEADAFNCFATGTGLVAAKIGQKTTVLLEALSFLGKPSEAKNVECKIVSKVTGETILGEVVVNQSSKFKYEISYKPNVKGRHDLHITVRERHIRASPFENVEVIRNIGNPLQTWLGLENPTYVAVSLQREIVVSHSEDSASAVSIPDRDTCIDKFDLEIVGLAVEGTTTLIIAVYSRNKIEAVLLPICEVVNHPDLKAIMYVRTEKTNDLALHSVALNPHNNKTYAKTFKTIQIYNSLKNFSREFPCIEGEQAIACGGAKGMVYVLDYPAVHIYTAEGHYEQIIQLSRGQFTTPGKKIAVDGDDIIYVSFEYEHCVSVYSSKGQHIMHFGGMGTSPGQFIRPLGLAVDTTGVVYVCDHGNNRVQAF